MSEVMPDENATIEPLSPKSLANPHPFTGQHLCVL